MVEKPLNFSNGISGKDIAADEEASKELGMTSGKPGQRSVRETNLRWIMLFFGCIFMMGNYFCYDIPGVAQTTFESAPYNFTALQVQLMYSLYSGPNTVLPLLGGLFVDKIGMRIGLFLFTMINTIGQFIYMIGGIRNDYIIMLIGRVVFGLGAESMGVAQSAIISQWFKGKELAFALGVHLTVARMASVIGGFIIPSLIDNDGGLVNKVMWVGSLLCVFCLISGVILCFIDRYAEQQDQQSAVISDTDKFKWSDLKEFTLPFWLVAISCVCVYSSIFPFIQASNTFLVEQYGFDKNTAGQLYSIPYFMSAALAPILGFIIDKFGKRAIFICLSSVLVASACFTSALIPNQTSPDFICLLPLVLIGFGYSIYASTLWSSIPYIVLPRTIGSAFGLVTSMQQIGLVIVPIVTGVLQDKHPGNFVAVDCWLGSLALIGVLFNVWLYVDDIKNRDAVLDKVPIMLTDLTVEPETVRPVSDRASSARVSMRETLKPEEMTEEERNAIKRSLAHVSNSFVK